ncbi:hypothetical protein RCL1_006701 [Eukaryota sp. TZLM3-RCL]
MIADITSQRECASNGVLSPDLSSGILSNRSFFEVDQKLFSELVFKSQYANAVSLLDRRKLAPDNNDTLTALKELHPFEDIIRIPTSERGKVYWEKLPFTSHEILKCIRQQSSTSSGGCSRVTFFHLKRAVDSMPEIGDALTEFYYKLIITSITPAQQFFAYRLVALMKPNGVWGFESASIRYVNNGVVESVPFTNMSETAVRCLGTWIGNETIILDNLQHELLKLKVALSKIADLNLVPLHLRFYTENVCFSSNLNHFNRLLNPQITIKIAKEFYAIKTTFFAKL